MARPLSAARRPNDDGVLDPIIDQAALAEAAQDPAADLAVGVDQFGALDVLGPGPGIRAEFRRIAPGAPCQPDGEQNRRQGRQEAL